MLGVLILLVSLSVAPQSQPPRDRVGTPDAFNDSAAREAELTKRLTKSPNGVAAYIELSELQENRSAFAAAEATLLRGRQAVPTDKAIAKALAVFYTHRGEFTKAVEAGEAGEKIDPTDPAGSLFVASLYWDKADKEHTLLPAERMQSVMSGIAAADRALALKPDYADAFMSKSRLLAMQAKLETDPVRKKELVAEAETLWNHAKDLTKKSDVPADRMSISPPRPDDPATAQPRVPPLEGIRQPTKIKDVRPVYPADALAARVTGVVVIEVSLDTEGKVRDATVLRSIPMLDEAALAAVRQWEFTPAVSNGVAVPVKMTVTVNFNLQ